jgi:hypothetical protein
MFNGIDYKAAFDEACDDLVHTRDRDEIRRILIGVEWVLEEAIRGVFVVLALILSLIIFMPLGFLFELRKINWMGQGLFFVAAIAFGLIVYWLAKFALWHEVNRHLKPRKFGELLFGDTQHSDKLV